MLICQLTDLHVRPVGKPANRMSETNMFTERAFRAVARLAPRPDVVVITGDLTECGLDQEYANFSHLLRRFLPMPAFVIPGNHDRRSNLRAALKHLPGVTSDPDYVQYTVDDYPVRLVMLDTLVPSAGHGELRPEQLDFLDRSLAAAPDKPTIVAMHHPPFMCGIAHMDRINLRNAAAFAAIIERHRQVERIICGHHHRPIVARVGYAIASIAPSVAHQVQMTLDPHDSGAFIFEPPAFQLHRWTDQDGVVTHTVYVEDFPGPYPFVNDPDYPGGA
ncbi:MAG TPA: phosphodiesterase [Acetobacteraceae bacterium]|jgi:3',5'-cyclic AMP phosphodiesterase CpdA|nr:phosphodiesterase [Acetobacteraceae bacterium]